MKKTWMAFLCAFTLIGVAALAAEVLPKAETPQAVTQSVPAEETAKQVLATTQKRTATTTAKETTIAPKTTAVERTTGQQDMARTYTGLFSLAPITYTAHDPENKQGLSTAPVNHSFGIAKNGQPNEISVNNQKRFDKSGYKVLAYDNKSTEKVLYLTFDCGYENGCTDKILNTLKEKKVPAAFFCTMHEINEQPQLIARMIHEGHIVGNHSNKHPNFTTISRTRMAEELEAVENTLRTKFGYSSKFFRFPEGAYNDSALELVDSLGYTTVFWSVAYADWDVNNQKGKAYALQTVTERLHPGAVILLHSVSPDNAEALGDIIDTARNMGYKFCPLTAYPVSA